MPPAKGSRKQSRTPCWCGCPEAELTEVECSNCYSWVHYTCAGLLLPELCHVINTTDVLYLCKVCCAKPNVDKIRRDLMETSDLSETHNFDQRAYHHANLKLLMPFTTTISAKLDGLLKQMLRFRSRFPQHIRSSVVAGSSLNLRKRVNSSHFWTHSKVYHTTFLAKMLPFGVCQTHRKVPNTMLLFVVYPLLTQLTD